MSNEFWIGAGAIAALSIVGWIAGTEFRLRKLQRLLLISQEQTKDEEIKNRTSRLSNDELDALLADQLKPKQGP